MRDRHFIALHRGGLLTLATHRLLMKWARECAMHVLPLAGKDIEPQLSIALEIAGEWEAGKVPAGNAIKASKEAHAEARKLKNPVHIAVGRSVGQAVATAHMADHSLQAALYALKATKLANLSLSEESNWQLQKLEEIAPEIKDLVYRRLNEKKIEMKILE